MKQIYVVAQNTESREWVPVAQLSAVVDGFELRYTRGAQRLPGFGGLSRMQALDKVFYSKVLFPFFANRLISKSRPEYRQQLRWLALEDIPSTPLDILAITGGVRATDAYELVAHPPLINSSLVLNFFARGLRYVDSSAISQLTEQKEGAELYILKDVQNTRDSNALAIRTESPTTSFIGYVPRYYCPGISGLLADKTARVTARIRRVNQDAPLDMRLLVSIQANVPASFDLFADIDDCVPLTAVEIEGRSTAAMFRTDLNIE